MREKSPYKTYADFLAERFPWKMQKLSVNLGCTCPNRDGTIGTGGCSYCDNTAFVPSYCRSGDDVKTQIEKGKEFFGRKYPDMHYLAYFQAFTSTYGDRRRLLDAVALTLAEDKVEGAIISTRPDCVDSDLPAELSATACGKRIMWEIGVETTHDNTLLLINRGHSWLDASETIRKLGDAGLDVCAHLIFGLPGETREMMLESVGRLCSLPVTSLKFHQLQILRDTPIHRQWLREPAKFNLFEADEYIDFCADVVKRVPPHIAIERFTASSPAAMLVAPKWGLKNYQFTNLLYNRLAASHG